MRNPNFPNEEQAQTPLGLRVARVREEGREMQERRRQIQQLERDEQRPQVDEDHQERLWQIE